MSLLQRFKPKGGAAESKTNQRHSSTSSKEANESQQVAEGFLCPECRTTFRDPDSLQNHFLDKHSDASSSSQQRHGSSSSGSPRNIENSFVCPQCMLQLKTSDELRSHFAALHEVSENRDGDVLAMRMELNDLRASLKEEKWYSEELKKELDKLQTKMNDNFRAPAEFGDEIGYYLQQIQVLEAGKALVTTQMLDTEKQLNEIKRVNESLRREKDRFLEKSASLSQDYAALMAKCDEESSQKTILKENLLSLQEKVCDLEAQLNARPSEDDVLVLRKELVHAQTLMDQLSQESEHEASQFQIRCSQLERKCSDYEEIVKDFTQRLENNEKASIHKNSESQAEVNKNVENINQLKEENEKLVKEMGELKTSLVESNQSVEHLKAENNSLKEKINNFNELIKTSGSETEKLKLELDKSTEQYLLEIKRKQEEINGLRDSCEKSAADLAAVNLKLIEVYRDNEELEIKRASLAKDTESLSKKCEQSEKHAKELKAQSATLQKNVESAEVRYNEKVKELSENCAKLKRENAAVQETLNDADRQNAEKDKVIDELKASVRNLDDKCNETLHKLQKSSQNVEELEETVKRITHEKEMLFKEKREIVEKLQAGEEGVSTALQQLNAEKTFLEQKIVSVEQDLSAVRTKFIEKTDEYERSLREALLKIKENEDFQCKLKAEVTSKDEKILNLNEINEVLNNEIAMKITDFESKALKMQEDFIDTSAALKAENEQIAQERDSLIVEVQSRIKSFDDLQKFAEGAMKKFENEANVAKALTEKIGILEETLKSKNKENEEKLKQLNEVSLEQSKFASEFTLLENEAISLRKNVADLNFENTKLNADLSKTKEELDRAKVEIGKLNEIVSNFESTVKNYSEKCDNWQKANEELNIQVEHLMQEKDQHRNEVQRLSSSNEEVSKRLTDLNSHLKERDQALSGQKEESTLAIKKLQQTVDELTAECLRLKEQLNINVQNSKDETRELAGLVNNLETMIDEQRTKNESLAKNEATLNSILEKTKMELEESTLLSASLSAQIETLEGDMEIKRKSIDELHKEKEVLTEKINKYATEMDVSRKNEEGLRKNEEGLRKNEETLKDEFEKLKSSATAEIASKNKELDDLRLGISEITKEKEGLKEETSKLEKQLKRVQENLQSLSTENVELKSKIENINRSYADLDATRLQLESLLKDLQRESESELAKEKKRAEQLEADAKKSNVLIQSLEFDLSSIKEESEKFREASKVVQKELESENKSLKTELADLRTHKQENDETSSAKIDDLNTRVNSLEESVTKIQNELEKSVAELETSKKECRTAVVEKRELEAQLSAWSEEKRMLLERCLLFEKDMEEEKDNGRELKRRLDDAISAMHELGRENQSLQIDMSKQFNRKWADDNEAVNCNACGKQFSVTLRKHHCRHCGMIFCNDCSLKSCFVASSKKPVRVCDNCYVELNGR